MRVCIIAETVREVTVSTRRIPTRRLPDVDQAGPGVPRPTRRRVETRRRLLAAALTTFAERGFYGSTVEDICERAGFTRGAFYSNFSSKEQLFFALHAERACRLIATIEAAVEVGEEAAPRGVEAFAEAVERFLSVRADDREWYLVNTEFTLHAVRHPKTAEVLAAHLREVRSRITQLLTRAIAESGRELTIEADALVRSILALHEGSLGQNYLEPDAVPPGHLEREVLPALLNAVSVRRTADDPA
jgi:AcrR family transcriptional regulator